MFLWVLKRGKAPHCVLLGLFRCCWVFCFLLNWTLDCDPNKNWTLNSSLLTFVFIDMFVVMLNRWMDGWLMNVDCARRRLQYQTSKHTSSSSVFMREGDWRHSGWLPIGGRYNRTLSQNQLQTMTTAVTCKFCCLPRVPPSSWHTCFTLLCQRASIVFCFDLKISDHLVLISRLLHVIPALLDSCFLSFLCFLFLCIFLQVNFLFFFLTISYNFNNNFVFFLCCC